VLSYEELHPYGTTAWWAEDGALEVSKRYRFTGMERDEETGLQYHSQRYYCPWLGRWDRPDPIGLGDGGGGMRSSMGMAQCCG
jgi:RHS repeat-associated protein